MFFFLEGKLWLVAAVGSLLPIFPWFCFDFCVPPLLSFIRSSVTGFKASLIQHGLMCRSVNPRHLHRLCFSINSPSRVPGVKMWAYLSESTIEMASEDAGRHGVPTGTTLSSARMGWGRKGCLSVQRSVHATEFSAFWALSFYVIPRHV